jgi:COP9 signalosome complex subunit 1
VEALKAAVAEAKSGKDIGRYHAAVEALHEVSPGDPDASPDVTWLAKMTRQVKTETDRLEAELKGYKNNLIKESIRVRLESTVQRSDAKFGLADGLR